MSLIQEALKRQQMEQEGKLPPPSGATPKPEPPPPALTTADDDTFILPGATMEVQEAAVPAARPALQRSVRPADPQATPPPASGPETPEPERKRISPVTTEGGSPEEKRTRVFPALAAMIILLLLLTGALVWAIAYGLELAGIRMPWSASETTVAEQPSTGAGSAGETPATAAAETPAIMPAVSESPTPARKPTIGSMVRTTVKDATAAATHADVVIADAAGDNVATAEPPVIAVAEPAAAQPAADKPQAPPAGKTPGSSAAVATAPGTAQSPATITWPDITISGVVGNEQKGAVFVNGKVIGVNESVEGIRILAIKPQGALVEYQGETRLAKVGQPINRATR